ncbi:hypothetical protein KQY27_06515 [Methanobrevibacter sp. TMH8]|nr:hypothetical protein [Methanobrevibacter sp. TMH8]MBZ9571192.1 hypothetical protein [Methanobrevibacter sp. TMH8]
MAYGVSYGTTPTGFDPGFWGWIIIYIIIAIVVYYIIYRLYLRRKYKKE